LFCFLVSIDSEVTTIVERENSEFTSTALKSLTVNLSKGDGKNLVSFLS